VVEETVPSYFFLSYAHGDQIDDDRVARFYDDLSTEIRVLTGGDRDEIVGFHDFGSLRAGQTWPRELIDALCVARTFVAFWSPRYFKSHFCGKEWSVFAGRVASYRAAAGIQPPAIIPVLWVPVTPPVHLGDLHHRDPSFGDAYQHVGLRELMRVDRWSEYKAFVGALAGRIRDIAERYELPEPVQRPDYHAVPSAFHPPDRAGRPDPVPPPVVPLAVELPPRDRRGPLPPRPILALDQTDQPDQQ
jgi:hypothetical protein